MTQRALINFGCFAQGEKSNTYQISLFFFCLDVKGTCTHAFTKHCCKFFTQVVAQFFLFPFSKKIGGGFVAQPLSQSKHSAQTDLCGLSLVEQRRASGLEGLDLKVSVVEWRGVMAQVCVFEQDHIHAAL